MRKKIVAGNWKMNTNLDEAVQLVQNILSGLSQKINVLQQKNVEVVIAPPSIFVIPCATLCKDYPHINVATQNCHSEKQGAFTGEISAAMIASTEANYVIIGHSERRMYFKETDEFLKQKLTAALQHNLTPIFCIGELLAEREAEQHFDIIKQQLEQTAFQLSESDFGKIVIAYEPVWAIGTGKTASPEQAQEIHAYIRELVFTKFGQRISEELSILYGGSCNALNAQQIFSMPDVDGGLIGGASLKANDFITIIDSL